MTYIPLAIIMIINIIFSKRKKIGEERQSKKQISWILRNEGASIPEKNRMLKSFIKRKQVFLPVLIAILLFLLILALGFNKPITIYCYEFSDNIDYLKYTYRSGDLKIDFKNKGNKVILTSKRWRESVSWIRFYNYNINWEDYDKIYLKVDFSEKVRFDQMAMLKIQQNDTTLSPINGKIKQMGTEKDKFLIEYRGSFYYQFEKIALDQDNVITVTLNKGEWQNFCIELALIKK